MMMIKKFSIIAAVFAGMTLTSCEDFFDVSPEDKLQGKDYPSTKSELYSGYMGLAACVQQVADKAIFIEGLRSNALEPTPNSTDEIIDIYNYNDLSDNEFVSPAGYYNVVLNVNDYIAHAKAFYEKNSRVMEAEEFAALVGSALRYKAWAYLMMAKLYGEAVWVDDPLTGYQDLSDYPVSDFNTLIENCIKTIETGITINGQPINGRGNIKWVEALQLSASENWHWDRITPPAEALLAELYLEKAVLANSPASYQKALDWGYAAIRLGDQGTGKPMFVLTNSNYNGEWSNLFISDLGKGASRESIFLMTYDYTQQQTN
ncbi:MAG: hypothetical protein LBD45_08410, partial [Bacteroidales bacterium]|nr:hypothetical protein [Bacteroidales bacterium]